MSGPTFVVISRVKGAVQVREMVESCIVTLREPTAERTPNKIHNAQSFNSRAVANVPCNNSSEVQLTTVVESVSIHVILVMLYSTGKLVIVSSPTPSVISAVIVNSVVTLLRLRFSPFTSHSTVASRLSEVQMNRASPPTLDVISLSLQPWPSA